MFILANLFSDLTFFSVPGSKSSRATSLQGSRSNDFSIKDQSSK